MTWANRSLAEVAVFHLGKMLDQKKNTGEMLPYLANVNVRWGQFALDNLREMRFEPYEQERYGLKYGDIVMCEGGEPGRCAIWKEQMPGMMYQKALHRIRPLSCLDHRFLYYNLRKQGQNGDLAGLFTGSTIKHLPREKLASISIPIPPLVEQRWIADLLSAYDDLIENSRRRIALLEEAARFLYREWFVHFRFPGHEHVKIADSHPVGWNRLVPSRIIANHISGGWGKDEPKGKQSEPAFVVRGTDIPRVESGDISSVDLRFHSRTSLRSRELAPYDLVFEISGGSSRQPIARTMLVTEERLKLWNSELICASFCKKLSFRSAVDALYFTFHVREHRDQGDVLVY